MPQEEQLRRIRARHWLRRSGPRIRDITQTIIAVGGLAIVGLLQIPWLEKPLERIGFGDDAEVTQAIIAIILVSLYFEIKTVAERTAQRSVEEVRHFADPIDVYPLLHQRIKAISRQDEKVLDVLGMTLYTAWPTIGFWLARPAMAGWTIRLAAVSENNQATAELVPAGWFKESRSHLDSVVEAAQSPVARQREIKLEAYGYDFVPVLHGFRLGNGDLFYSILKWHEEGKISRDGFSYEYIPSHDLSDSAEAIRAIFSSWFDRATQTPWTT